jgi:hypothetical protein
VAGQVWVRFELNHQIRHDAIRNTAVMNGIRNPHAVAVSLPGLQDLSPARLGEAEQFSVPDPVTLPAVLLFSRSKIKILLQK